MFFVDIEKYNVIYLTKQCFLRFCSSCQDSINQEAILAISFVCIVTVLTSKFKNYFLWYCMMHEAEGVMSFMSREHLLLHTGEDTIHDPKIEKKNLSPKDKRKNFWFYHKWHIVIVLVVLVFAALLSKDFFNRVNPDYEIGLLTKTSFPEEAVNQAKQKKIRRVAQFYLIQQGTPPDTCCRFDVIAIGGDGTIVHFQNAFGGI